jgi:hypothetical protein
MISAYQSCVAGVIGLRRSDRRRTPAWWRCDARLELEGLDIELTHGINDA